MPLKRAVQTLGILVLVGLIVVLGVAVKRAQDKGSFGRAILRGERPVAPTFDLAELGGPGRVRLADLRGSPVVVNIWAAWCVECEDEAPLLRQMVAEQGARGVRFVGVDYKDTREAAAGFLARYRPGFRSAVDDGRMSAAYGVTGVPETFVIDRSGRAVAWFQGQFDPDALRTAIEIASS